MSFDQSIAEKLRSLYKIIFSFGVLIIGAYDAVRT